MYAAKLTPQQRDQIIRRLQPTGSYLIRMAERMQKLGWHADDPLYVHCWKAHEELVRVLMALHYADTGTAWQPPPDTTTGDATVGLAAEDISEPG
jgi:hypothetical protein